MKDSYTEQVAALIVVTTFTCVGLLALWAATSPRHWFVRTAATIAVFFTLLLIPAPSLFLIFLTMTALIAAGIAASRRWRRWRDAKFNDPTYSEMQTPRIWQFSIKSALAACTCIAVLAAVAVRIPAGTWIRAPLFVVIALVNAIVALLAAWIVYGRGVHVARVSAGFVFPIVLIGSIFLLAKHFDATFALRTMLIAFSTGDHPIALLSTIAIAEFAASLLALLLLRKTSKSSSTSSNNTRKLIWARAATALLLIALATPPILMMAVLLRPLPTVENTLPIPNGYVELVRLGTQLKGCTILRELAADVVDDEKVDAAVPNYAAEYAAIHKALDVPCRIPIVYNEAVDIDMTAVGALRDLERMIAAKAHAALRAGTIDEALACQQDILRLAHSICNGGLLVHLMVATAVENAASQSVYTTIDKMNSSQCRDVVRRLTNFDRQREEYDRTRERELVWITKTAGWPMRAIQIAQRVSGEDDAERSAVRVFQMNEAVLRLLIIEVALRAYQLDHGSLPTQLTALAPEYLAAQPVDPFASADQPFHYRVTKTGFELWSVGPDGVDDNGGSLKHIEHWGVDLESPGDLRLDDYFAPK